MKEYIKRIAPSLYKTYKFHKLKKHDEKVIKYYDRLPESEYEHELARLYFDRVGHIIDFKNPKRFTEKIQWRKLHELTPLMSELSDKYAVRAWVEKKIGKEYLIPLIGAWDNFEDIDFSILPDSFVLKTNNASGTNIIVDSKNQLDLTATKRLLQYWIERPFGLLSGLELQYLPIKPLILAEENLLSGDMDDLPDYKFFCFHGNVFCSYTMINYTRNHYKGKLGFFDRDYNLMDVYREDYGRITHNIPKPINYERMVEIAEILSEDFSHVRVDLYNVEGKIYFGEMTFTTNSGFTNFVPDDFDYLLGEQWILPING